MTTDVFIDISLVSRGQFYDRARDLPPLRALGNTCMVWV
jgi:hypothetical protein